jgi:hypothetical protein
MRAETDGLLSLQRYFGMVLPVTYDVRTALEVGQEPERPYALITLNATTLNRVARQRTMVVTVHVFPAPADTMAASKTDELELRELLLYAVEFGHPGTGARPERLPLWDFDPPPGPRRLLDANGNVQPFRVSRGYFLRVDADPTVSSRREVEDPRWLMVALDLRCTLPRGHDVPSGQTILQSIRSSGGPEG